jgi:thiamine biosynthesis protein ThiS
VRITVNRRPEEFPEDELSVSEVFARLRFSFPHIIARLNGRLVKKSEWAITMLHEGDALEADHLIGGG